MTEEKSDSNFPAFQCFRPEPLPAALPNDPRIRVVSSGIVGHKGHFVVYWPQIQRRANQNAGLSYAIHCANAMKQPLLVYEALRVDYPFASDRIHSFVLEAAQKEAKKYKDKGVKYTFFLPKSKEEARGVLAKLSQQASLIVTDDYPTFVVPQHTSNLSKKVKCPLIAFDDCSVVPLSLFPKEEYAARTIRPKILKALPMWFRPIEENKCVVFKDHIELPFDEFLVETESIPNVIQTLPIDHNVKPVAITKGGSDAAEQRLTTFINEKLSLYLTEHNHPDSNATSGLSGYIHFGMIGSREVAVSIAQCHAKDVQKNAFLEQLIVRRTLAFNFALTNPLHTSFDSLPDWSKKTLEAHQKDRRDKLYSRYELEKANTYDKVWNAAQRELVETGTIHNYLRMIWGKCVLAWKTSPKEAFDDLVYLNDKYALDGRDPNTYASILWCFGKHDRAWGPERPIFGLVRYMSTEQTLRKLRMSQYMTRWG